MKAKVVNGQVVCVMSQKEATFISSILANMGSNGHTTLVNDVGSALWNLVGYPEENFMDSDPGCCSNTEAILNEHMELYGEAH